MRVIGGRTSGGFLKIRNADMEFGHVREAYKSQSKCVRGEGAPQ